MAETFSNFAKTTLSSTITSTGLSIVVADGSLFPTANFYIVIDGENAAREIVFVASRSSNTLTVTSTGQRGNKGTTAAAHTAGASVIHTVLAHNLGLWTSYTPTWAAASGSPSISNGTLSGAYTLIGGDTMHIQIYLLFGSTTTSGTSGTWSFTIPSGFTAVTNTRNQAVGSIYILDNGNQIYTGTCFMNSAGALQGQTPGGNAIGVTVPFTWGNSDELSMCATVRLA